MKRLSSSGINHAQIVAYNQTRGDELEVRLTDGETYLINCDSERLYNYMARLVPAQPSQAQPTHMGIFLARGC
jgi:hypothetical protein